MFKSDVVLKALSGRYDLSQLLLFIIYYMMEQSCTPDMGDVKKGAAVSL